MKVDLPAPTVPVTTKRITSMFLHLAKMLKIVHIFSYFTVATSALYSQSADMNNLTTRCKNKHIQNKIASSLESAGCIYQGTLIKLPVICLYLLDD